MPYDGYVDPDYAREKRERRNDESYWTGHGSDDGYDAIKDANAERGLPHNSGAGFRIAKQKGWLRKTSD